MTSIIEQMTPINPHSERGKQRLDAMIATSQPLTAVLERYYHDHRAYPPKLAAMYPTYLSKSREANNDFWHGYYYYTDSTDNQVYYLNYKLGWDPYLVYSHIVRSKSPQVDPEGWVYDPGNGNPKTQL